MTWAEVYPWRPPAAGEAVIRHVYDQVRGAIHAGALPAAGRLPSSRALASRLGVARASVVGAYDQLLAEGYVEGRHGAGTFVAADLSGVLDLRAPMRPPPAATPRLPAKIARLEAQAWPSGEAPQTHFTNGRTLMDPRAKDAWLRSTRRALRTLGDWHFGYGDTRGDLALRTQITGYLRAARGVVCEPEQIIITCGAQHAIDLCVRLLLERGDAVWLEDPGYPATWHALGATEAKLHAVPVDRSGLDVAAGVRLAPAARMAFVTPSHQYPLGVSLSLGRRLELLAWAREAGAWIVEDDYASEFRYAGPPLASLQGLDGGERVIYVGTFNKSLFPGLRMGYLVAPRPLAAAFAAARQLVDRQPATLTQAIVLDFLQSGQFAAHIRRRRLAYRAQRDALAAALAEQLGHRLQVDIPDQGMHLIAYLTDGTSDRAVERAARQSGLVARAISPLYHDAPSRSGLLLGFSGFEAAGVAPAVKRLTKVMETMR